jgi:hypothetical protein
LSPPEVQKALQECQQLIKNIRWEVFTQWKWLEEQTRKPLVDMGIEDVTRVCAPFAELIMVLRDAELERR